MNQYSACNCQTDPGGYLIEWYSGVHAIDKRN